MSYVNPALVPTAQHLIGVVYDCGPDELAATLDGIPEESRGDLLVLLAAMVDPDKSPKQLLAWTKAGPVQSRDGLAREEKAQGKSRKSRRHPREHGTERGYRQHVTRHDMPACARCSAANRAMEARRYAQRKAAGKTLEKAS